MSSSILTSFLGALQASLSVLLTISYGVIAAQFNLISDSSASDISQLSVKLFLPALLISKVGSELHAGTAIRYAPILVWAIFCNLFSLALALGLKKLFKFPSWTVPAIAFNNTLSLPLLLVQSLGETGILQTLIVQESDNVQNAIERATSYFLVNSVVGDMLCFSLGPKLLDKPSDKKDEDDGRENGQDNVQEGSEEQSNDESQHNGQLTDESTSLLPKPVIHTTSHAAHKLASSSDKALHSLPQPLQTLLSSSTIFLNPPLIGAVIGAILGLVPPFHKAFFADPQSGGIFTAWLTASIKNIGQLFATLQIVVVGVKLCSCLIRMKRGEESGPMPYLASLAVLAVRFLVWPLISIPILTLLSRYTSILPDDPILWFTMMLMPIGPPALKLTAMADVSGADEKEKLTIAKFLTLAYAVSPLVAFGVVGGLKGCEQVLAGGGGG